MVSLASVILLSGIGLALFFSKDIIGFLNSLRGFGTGDLNVSLLPPIQFPELPKFPEFEFPKFPEFELPKFPEFEFPKFEFPVIKFPTSIEDVFGTTKVGGEITEGKVIPQLGRVDPRRQTTAVKTTLERLPPDTPLPITAGSLTQIISRLGGQTIPKMIITKETVTEAPDPIPKPTPIIEAKQPDLSLVSPFLKPIIPKTRGELRFGR